MARDDQLDTIAGFLNPSVDLLKYYRSKIVGFEAERADYIQRLAVVERHNGDLHKLRWELRSREEEVEELQKALADAKVVLFDEREQVLKLQAENDSLKSQEIEDRKRIQHLLAMTEPVTREVCNEALCNRHAAPT
jgi:coiled-coil domain-containing protein 77